MSKLLDKETLLTYISEIQAGGSPDVEAIGSALADHIDTREQQIATFYAVLAHGDEKHCVWLKDMVHKHFGLDNE